MTEDGLGTAVSTSTFNLTASPTSATTNDVQTIGPIRVEGGPRNRAERRALKRKPSRSKPYAKMKPWNPR